MARERPLAFWSINTRDSSPAKGGWQCEPSRRAALEARSGLSFPPLTLDILIGQVQSLQGEAAEI